MIRLIALIALIFNGINLYAQQCGFENYFLFVVNPHFELSTETVPNLNMYLVDENENAIRVPVTYEENNSWQTRSDTLFFWNNKNVKEFGRPLFRRTYYNIGNYYVVAFRLNTYDLKSAANHPLYKVKIEGFYNSKTKENQPAQVFNLPVQKSVRICNNGVLNNYKYEMPVKTLDGNIFEPIDIVLDKPAAVKANAVNNNDGVNYAVKFNYLPVHNHMEEITTYTIQSAKIYDTRNGKLHQEIYIDSKLKLTNNDSKHTIEFEDFYNRGLKEAEDFSVVIDSWRDLEYMVYKNQRNFYIFNSVTKKYELDTTLSNYTNVTYYKPLKTMRRFDFKLTSVSRINLTYQLNNKQWELIEQTESFFKPPTPPPIKYSSKTCILFSESSHILPLQAITAKNETQLITDTFWLYNACDDTVFISNVESVTKDFFSINQTLLPKQRTPLIFNGILEYDTYFLNNKLYTCILKFADNFILSFTVNVPIISNGASVFYYADSTINYAIGKQENKRYTEALFTYPNGRLRAKGLILDGDTNVRVGIWRHFKDDGAWTVDEIVYSKAVYLSAFNEENSGQNTKFKVKVLENGLWKQAITDIYNNELRLFITKATDSIMAYTDSTSFTFALAYKELLETTSKQFYLLKPNQRSLKIGYYTMPFNTIDDSYALIPNYAVIKSNNKTTNQLVYEMIESLENKYPKLKLISVYRNQPGFNTQYLSSYEKQKLFRQLEQDSNIAVVCKLYSINGKQIGFCNNSVYVQTTTDKIGRIRSAASNNGFTNVTEEAGYNRFWLTYTSKILDEEFFEDFKALSENEFIIGTFLNTYINAEPDYDFNSKY